MKEFDYSGCIKRLNELSESIKKSNKEKFSKLFEGVHFNEEDEDTKGEEEFVEEESNVDGGAFFNDIRKICLNGIGKLSSDPNSQEYEGLKKIWDICDKMQGRDSRNRK